MARSESKEWMVTETMQKPGYCKIRLADKMKVLFSWLRPKKNIVMMNNGHQLIQQ